jgi:hypothetical protein
MRVVSCKVSVVPVTDTSPPRPRRLLALTTLVPLIITLVPPGIGLKGNNGSDFAIQNRLNIANQFRIIRIVISVTVNNFCNHRFIIFKMILN